MCYSTQVSNKLYISRWPSEDTSLASRSRYTWIPSVTCASCFSFFALNYLKSSRTTSCRDPWTSGPVPPLPLTHYLSDLGETGIESYFLTWIVRSGSPCQCKGSRYLHRHRSMARGCPVKPTLPCAISSLALCYDPGNPGWISPVRLGLTL